MDISQIVVLMTCHNRRQTTLECLQRLFGQELPAECSIKVFLVDDGSTDGTSEAVEEGFPQVRIIQGDGSLYWNQGMRLAWQTAAEEGDFDAYLWLNDDTMLLEGAVQSLLETLEAQILKTGQPGIIVGSCRAPLRDEEKASATVSCIAKGDARSSHHSSVLTYGGRRKKGLIEPSDQPQEILAFNGNLVLVTREVYQALGNLNPAYRHAYGDIDYGLSARKRDLPIWLAPGYLAECPKNRLLPWRDPDVPLAQRWKHFGGVKGVSISEVKALQKTAGRGHWLFTLCTQLGYVLSPHLRNKINAWRYGK